MKYLIWSIEHNAWWCANHNGYTDKIKSAGVYEYSEAYEIVRQANLYLKDTVHESLVPLSGDVIDKMKN